MVRSFPPASGGLPKEPANDHVRAGSVRRRVLVDTRNRQWLLDPSNAPERVCYRDGRYVARAVFGAEPSATVR